MTSTRSRGSRWLSLALRLAGLAGMVGLAGIACSQSDPDRGRVLLIGVDGATLRVAEPLMQQDRLPHLSRIAKEGVYGALESFRPLHSPRIWNTIATGKVPEKHGISTFTYAGDDGEQ